MVIRIAPDSDFESEDEMPVVRGGKGDEYDESEARDADHVAPESSPKPTATPRSVRKVVRQTVIESTTVGTYDYDSDIYTEESSMGSFIVHSDEEDDAQQSADENTGLSPYKRH